MNGAPRPQAEVMRKVCITGAAVIFVCGLFFYLYSTCSGTHSYGAEGSLTRTLAEQKDHVEQSYWENVGFDMDALAQLPKETFADSLVMLDFRGFRKKFLWDYFLPHFSCPQKEKVGVLARDGDQGKWLCGVRSLLQRPGCVVYSFGSNGEMSFEEGIRNRTKCEIHVFDPTLTPEQKAKVLAVPGVQFHDYGLGVSDGYVKSNPQMTMHRAVSGFNTKTLPTIMQELGHTWVDVMKMDIEEAEWAVLDNLIREPGPLPFTQLQVEYHNFGTAGKVRTNLMLSVMARMITKDMRVFSVEPNLWGLNSGFDCVEYAYLQVDKMGNIVTGSRAAAAAQRKNIRLTAR